ncbi:hypothetical protein G6031_09520 [Dietzia sp. CQ4]|uniref:hypothetical protein n=1 Tax=Dietzia sp. (strain CQ4) TaxID=370437 RepID=UPI0015FDD8C3|nr:hypothetical protein [Dietzia sp. CQ4]MBB1034626.1 hypothetical protein [Dietzia sp. CQ4]
MVTAVLLSAIAGAVVVIIRYLRATRAARTARRELDRERDHLNRTWNYQTGRVQR